MAEPRKFSNAIMNTDWFNHEWERFEKYRNQHELTNKWSIYGEFVQMDELTLFEQVGKIMIYRFIAPLPISWTSEAEIITGPTWGDLYKTADKLINKSNETIDHPYIEGFEIDDEDRWILITGS